MSLSKEIWRRKLAIHLFELGSIEFQEKAWVGKIDNYISFYSELINSISDCGLPECLEDFYKESFISEEEMTKLRLLLEEIDKTDDFKEWENFNSYDECKLIWDDPLWRGISTMAESLFLEHFVSDYLTDEQNKYSKSRLREYYSYNT